MIKKCALPLVMLLLLPAGAWAQAYQNNETSVLFGAAFGSTQVIGGSNVTVDGSPGFSTAVGFAFQVMRKSAVSLWVEPFPVITAIPGGSANIPGSASANSELFVPSARLMVPVQSRISLFGALGGGVGYFHNYTLTSDVPPQLKVHGVYHGVAGAGGGVDFRISRHVSIRVDARDYVTGRDLGGVLGRNHFLPLLGVAFHY